MRPTDHSQRPAGLPSRHPPRYPLLCLAAPLSPRRRAISINRTRRRRSRFRRAWRVLQTDPTAEFGKPVNIISPRRRTRPHDRDAEPSQSSPDLLRIHCPQCRHPSPRCRCRHQTRDDAVPDKLPSQCAVNRPTNHPRSPPTDNAAWVGRCPSVRHSPSDHRRSARRNLIITPSTSRRSTTKERRAAAVIPPPKIAAASFGGRLTTATDRRR